MDSSTLIQDLGVVLAVAAVAAMICRRFGQSVVVGYLIAGLLIGPYTPPFSLVVDVERIQTLSQIGLVFLMFGIGLSLSLSKLGRIGWPMLVATGLGAFGMLNLTQLLAPVLGWHADQTLFVAAMFMVSSSAVIAKIISEQNLGHERAGQLALGITLLEDVVAVVMLTILAARSGGGKSAEVGAVLTGISAFVVLLVGAGLLMVPRLLRRLEAKADPEIQTIAVAALLFLLSIAALRAGYSLALGAFLLGAIVAEIPQRVAVEKSFAGMRDLFSSVFFVSIGMMIDVRLLQDVWWLVIVLSVFALVGRGIATTVALIACGTPPRQARRAGLLLGPLGEFSFIIAQLGVSAAVLPKSYYPVAVGVSLLTVLIVPGLNRQADVILDTIERLEPAWLKRTFEAYHSWLAQVRSSPTPSVAWRFVRTRLMQSGVELLFATGVMIFSRDLLGFLVQDLGAFGLEPRVLGYAFWSGIALIVLIPLVAIWRNLMAMAMIVGEAIGDNSRLPAPVIRNGLSGLGAVMLAYWLYAVVPVNDLGVWGWLVVGAATAVIVTLFSRRLIYWHSEWQNSVAEVLAEDPDGRGRVPTGTRERQQRGLEEWNLILRECILPDWATAGGQSIGELALPSRFGCTLVEVERNGYVITTIHPDVRIYPGDKLLLLGQEEQVDAACAALEVQRTARGQSEEFNGSVLESIKVPASFVSGQTLAALNIGQVTGVRIVGIHRGSQRSLAPSGGETLEPGDDILVSGTLNEIRAFRDWLAKRTA